MWVRIGNFVVIGGYRQKVRHVGFLRVVIGGEGE